MYITFALVSSQYETRKFVFLCFPLGVPAHNFPIVSAHGKKKDVRVRYTSDEMPELWVRVSP